MAYLNANLTFVNERFEKNSKIAKNVHKTAKNIYQKADLCKHFLLAPFAKGGDSLLGTKFTVPNR